MLSDFQELIFSAKLGDKVKEVQEIHENFKFIYGYTDSYGETISNGASYYLSFIYLFIKNASFRLVLDYQFFS